MEFDLPLYAVQRLADGTWLVRTQMGDPLWPPVDVVAVVGEQTDIRRDPESAAAEAASAQVISSMRDSAQVTFSGAINSMIAAMSTRPNRQNRSTCSRISVPIALTAPPPCEPVHMRCAPMRRTRAHCAREMDDLAAELRLRNLELPLDSVRAEALQLRDEVKRLGPDAPSDGLDERIRAFLAKRKKPKN